MARTAVDWRHRYEELEATNDKLRASIGQLESWIIHLNRENTRLHDEVLNLRNRQAIGLPISNDADLE